VNGRTMGGSLVTGNFFQVLGVGAAQGRVLTPADDDARQPAVVLSDRGWTTHFANDPAVLSRSLLINGIRYDIVGVMPKGFRGLMVGAPDYWASLSLIEQLQPALAAEKKEIDVDIIGRLRPGMSREVALAQLIAWDSRRIDGGEERRSAGITLVPRRGTVPQPMESVLIFTPLFASFGLILLIGCANVASLLLARAVSRQKEVGVRLSLGASRGQIVRQLLTESVILALAAAVLGYDAAGYWRRAAARTPGRLARRRVPDRRRGHGQRHVWSGAGVAGDADRTGAHHARRNDARRAAGPNP
jgi:hypothetical protein